MAEHIDTTSSQQRHGYLHRIDGLRKDPGRQVDLCRWSSPAPSAGSVPSRIILSSTRREGESAARSTAARPPENHREQAPLGPQHHLQPPRWMEQTSNRPVGTSPTHRHCVNLIPKPIKDQTGGVLDYTRFTMNLKYQAESAGGIVTQLLRILLLRCGHDSNPFHYISILSRDPE